MKSIYKLLMSLAVIVALAMPVRLEAQGASCPITISGSDSFGDGWNGASISIYQGTELVGTFTLASNMANHTAQYTVNNTDSIRLVWNSGSYDYEATFTVTDGFGVQVVSASGNNYSNGGVIAMFMANCPNCLAPSNLTFDNATTSSITFHWTRGDAENEWEVMVGDSVINGVTDTFVTVNELMPSTNYLVTVRSVCGWEDTSQWIIPVSMTTSCGSVTQLPVTYTFEGDFDNEMPICWSRPEAMHALDWYSGAMASYPAVADELSYAHGGTKSLLFYEYGSAVTDGPGYAVSPYIVGNPAAMHVTFWMQSEGVGSYVVFEAGVMSDPADTSTFVALMSTTADPTSYTQYEFNTNTLTGYQNGDSICVAFRVRIVEGNGYGIVIIDDVLIESLGTCMPPTLGSGSIDSVSYDMVQLSWACDDVPDDFDVMLLKANGYGFDTLHYSSSNTSVTINELEGNTTYQAYVASMCGFDTTNYIFIGQFQTNSRCYAAASPTVISLTSNAATLQWNLVEGGIDPTEVILTLMDLTDSIVFSPVYVTDTNIYTFTNLTTNHSYRVSLLVVCGIEDSSSVVSTSFMAHGAPCAEFNGTSSSSYIPFYGYYKYSYSQQLYDNSLINGFDTLNGISFYVNTSHTLSHTIDIYLGYTNQTSVGGSDYIPVSQLTKVVSDYTVRPNATGWLNVIPFDTLFVCSDSGNLVVAIDNKTGSYQSGLTWKCHNATVGNGVYWYTDNGQIDPSTTTLSPHSIAMAPDIQFFGNCDANCSAPSVTVSSVDSNSISLTWLVGNDETSWVVQYRVDTVNRWTTAGRSNTTSFTINGLEPATNYMIRVGSICDDTVYSSAVSALTGCASVHVGYHATLRTNLPCWTYLPGGSYYFSSTYNSFYLYTSYAGIISPAIDEDITTLQVILVDSDPYEDGTTYSVGVCDANGDNITWIQTVTATPAIFDTNVVYLNNYTGNHNHIIIKNTSGYSAYIRSIAIETIDNCLPVQNLTLNSISTNDAWLSWRSEGSTFEVRYRISGATAWNTLTVNDTVVHLTGLTPSSHYDVEVSNICSSTESSTAASIQITSGCVNVTVPYNESFGSTELPVCWNTVPGYAYYTWEETAANGYDYIYSYASSATAPADDWVMTPIINIPVDAAFNNVSLVYGTGGGSATSGSISTYQVLVSTTGNNAAFRYTDTLFVDTVDTRDPSSGDYNIIYRRIPLSNYAGQSISFAFRNLSSRYGMVLLTDVSVRSTLAPLYNIIGNATAYTGESNNYIAVYQEGDTNGMTLSWSSSMAAAGQAVMTSSATDSMHITYNSAGIDTITFTASNTHGTFTLASFVNVYQCDAINTFPWSEGFDSESSISCWRQSGDYVWTIGSGDSRDATVPHSGTGNLRLLHHNTNDITRLISPMLDLSGVANVKIKFWHIQHVWSGDQDELHVLGRASATDTWTVLASYTNDINDWQLDSIAINSHSSTYQFAFEGHDHYGYGIAIDDLVVEGDSACAVPGIIGFVPADNAITVNYTAVTDSVEMVICAGAFDAGAPSVMVAGGSHTFTGLTHSTLYHIGIRAKCSDSDFSEWNIDSVSTLVVNCLTPTDVTIQATGYTNATIGWTATGDETAWGIHVYNNVYNFTYTATTNPYTVTDLISGVTYNVEVRALCGQNNDIEGDWSAAEQFTTDICEPVSGINVTEITANSATVNWQPAQGSIGYKVFYGHPAFYDNEATTAEVAAGDNSYIITGLAPETDYEVYVRNRCTETLYSNITASDRMGFTTNSGGEGIYDVVTGTLTLFPNPANSQVTLTVSGFDGAVEVEIVDMNGRVSGNWQLAAGDWQLDISALSQGAYFVRVTGERQTAVRKLIVR